MLDAGPGIFTPDYMMVMTTMRPVADSTPIRSFYPVFTGAAL